MVVLDSLHWRHSVQMQSYEDGVGWPAGLLRMYYSLWVDGKPISLAHSIKQSNIAIISVDSERRKARLTNTMQSPMSYVPKNKE